MTDLNLSEADAIVHGVMEGAVKRGLRPIAVAVLDGGGHVVVMKRQDNASFLRIEIATAKAWTAISLAGSSRDFAAVAEARPNFAVSLVSVSQGQMIPAAGGLLIYRDGGVVGSVGVSGDTPDNDEAAASDGIVSAGLSSTK